MASDYKSDDYGEFKQRLKKSKKESSVEDNEGGITKKQILLYGAVVVVCFITIYPRMIHPMIKMALGYTDAVKRADTDDIPPQMKMRGQPAPGSRPGMRPPPGARGEGGQHAESSKGGGGITGMILPVYAVGIVVYLLYTASKVYGSSGKTKKKKADVHDEVYSLITEKLAGIDLEKVLCGEDLKGAEEINKLAEFLRGRNETDGAEIIDNSDTQEEPVIPRDAMSGRKMSQKASVSESVPSTEDDDDNIEELMRKCENKEPMSPEEMSRVQKRLLEMENRMSRLMASLNNVQQTSQLVAKEIGKTAAAASEPQHAEQLKATDSKDDLENDGSESQVSDESLPSMRESEIEEIYDQVDSECSNISGDEVSGDGEAGADERHENLRRRNVQNSTDSNMI